MLLLDIKFFCKQKCLIFSCGFPTDDALVAKSAKGFGIETTCFEFLFNLSVVKTTQRTKTSSGGRGGGELLSERQTTHMNGIRGDPFRSSIVSGCQWRRALGESRWHIMWCRELDARLLCRTATLMIWAAFLELSLMWPWKCRTWKTFTILFHYTVW